MPTPEPSAPREAIETLKAAAGDETAAEHSGATKTCYYCGKIMDWDSVCHVCGNTYSFLYHQ